MQHAVEETYSAVMDLEEDFLTSIALAWRAIIAYPFISSLVVQNWGMNVEALFFSQESRMFELFERYGGGQDYGLEFVGRHFALED